MFDSVCICSQNVFFVMLQFAMLSLAAWDGPVDGQDCNIITSGQHSRLGAAIHRDFVAGDLQWLWPAQQNCERCMSIGIRQLNAIEIYIVKPVGDYRHLQVGHCCVPVSASISGGIKATTELKTKYTCVPLYLRLFLWLASLYNPPTMWDTIPSTLLAISQRVPEYSPVCCFGVVRVFVVVTFTYFYPRLREVLPASLQW